MKQILRNRNKFQEKDHMINNLIIHKSQFKNHLNKKRFNN